MDEKYIKINEIIRDNSVYAMVLPMAHEDNRSLPKWNGYSAQRLYYALGGRENDKIDLSNGHCVFGVARSNFHKNIGVLYLLKNNKDCKMPNKYFPSKKGRLALVKINDDGIIASFGYDESSRLGEVCLWFIRQARDRHLMTRFSFTIKGELPGKDELCRANENARKFERECVEEIMYQILKATNHVFNRPYGIPVKLNVSFFEGKTRTAENVESSIVLITRALKDIGVIKNKSQDWIKQITFFKKKVTKNPRVVVEVVACCVDENKPLDDFIQL